jgi:Tol biopolymer transport system component
MNTTLRLPTVPRVAWLLVVLALLIAVGLAIVAVGARARPAPPFGLARNGSVVYGRDGDLFKADPLSGLTTALVAESTDDLAPNFSRDGTQMTFLRSEQSGVVSLMVARADGSDIHAVLKPVSNLTWVDWSPDGTRLAVTSDIGGRPQITIVRADGSGSRTLDIAGSVDNASWRPPDGTELVFRGQPGGPDSSSGLFAIRPDGTGLRPLTSVPGDATLGYQSPLVSPDGRRIAYTSWSASSTLVRQGIDTCCSLYIPGVHIFDTATGADTVLQTSPGVGQAVGVFSPNGHLVAYQVWSIDGRFRLAVAPADGSAAATMVGPWRPMPSSGDSPAVQYDFSPDGSQVIAVYQTDGTVLDMPVDGNNWTTEPWGTSDLPSMQRLAP